MCSGWSRCAGCTEQAGHARRRRSQPDGSQMVFSDIEAKRRAGLSRGIFAWPDAFRCKHTSIITVSSDRNRRVYCALVLQIEVIHSKCSGKICVGKIPIDDGHACFVPSGNQINALEIREFADARRRESRLRRRAARRYHRQYRAQCHRHVAWRRGLGAAVGGERLHHRLCRVHSDGRRARRPHRRQAVFMAGFAIFTAASVACALAPNAAILIAARCVQGLAAAILVPNSLALLSHAYPDEKARGRAVGVWAAGASLALTAGPCRESPNSCKNSSLLLAFGAPL
jgi:Major Facilitator Superfamily